MANKNFPGLSINRLIETDPQIVKVAMDYTEWGTRRSLFKNLGSDPTQPYPSQPNAKEMTIKHTNGS